MYLRFTKGGTATYLHQQVQGSCFFYPVFEAVKFRSWFNVSLCFCSFFCFLLCEIFIYYIQFVFCMFIFTRLTPTVEWYDLTVFKPVHNA